MKNRKVSHAKNKYQNNRSASLSVITLNVCGVNFVIKSQRFAK